MTTSCSHQKTPIACPCTYVPCSRHGKCCECVAYHRASGEVPGCFFSLRGERTYDRSIESFIAEHGERNEKKDE